MRNHSALGDPATRKASTVRGRGAVNRKDACARLRGQDQRVWIGVGRSVNRWTSRGVKGTHRVSHVLMRALFSLSASFATTNERLPGDSFRREPRRAAHSIIHAGSVTRNAAPHDRSAAPDTVVQQGLAVRARTEIRQSSRCRLHGRDKGTSQGSERALSILAFAPLLRALTLFTPGGSRSRCASGRRRTSSRSRRGACRGCR